MTERVAINWSKEIYNRFRREDISQTIIAWCQAQYDFEIVNEGRRYLARFDRAFIL